jgi:hypothetical protein
MDERDLADKPSAAFGSSYQSSLGRQHSQSAILAEPATIYGESYKASLNVSSTTPGQSEPSMRNDNIVLKRHRRWVPLNLGNNLGRNMWKIRATVCNSTRRGWIYKLWLHDGEIAKGMNIATWLAWEHTRVGEPETQICEAIGRERKLKTFVVDTGISVSKQYVLLNTAQDLYAELWSFWLRRRAESLRRKEDFTLARRNDAVRSRNQRKTGADEVGTSPSSRSRAQSSFPT